MRGIEGALFVLKQVREGRFAGETLRSLGDRIPEKELSLASSLAYLAIRREPLWKEIYTRHMKFDSGKRGSEKGPGSGQKLPATVTDCLLLGTAGLLGLWHFSGAVLVNGLLEALKDEGQAWAVSLVNAVLRGVGRDGEAIMENLRRSPRWEERALWAGIPVWSLPAWKRTWNNDELRELFDLMQLPPRTSLRAAPGKRDAARLFLEKEGIMAVPSDIFPDALRLSSTILPTQVPGFETGELTVQSEGSMLVGSLARHFYEGGLILDMCSGRGIKAGQMARELPNARLECWEISHGKHRAAAGEMRRLSIGERVKLRVGDALSLSTSEAPGLILLDAPCSGSGTWNRKPENKWKLSWTGLDRICFLQKSLLRRALTLVATGGIIIYATCSLLRQENENIVAEALSDRPDCEVLNVPWTGRHLRPGRPWGMYVWPTLPWLDGFYVAVIMKKFDMQKHDRAEA